MYFLRILPFLFLLFVRFTFAEGTKQLKPDTTKNCDIVFGSASSYYPCIGMESCDSLHKFYVRVASNKEKVYIGVKPMFWMSSVTLKIKLGASTVLGPVTINSSSPGAVNYYSQAIAGPNVLSPAGYTPLVFTPPGPGDYSLNFNSVSLVILDVTVIDTTLVPRAAIDGRLYARDWHFSTGSIAQSTGEFLGTLFMLTEDSVVTSVYFNRMKGHSFDVTTTRNGCYPPPAPWELSCRSDTGNHHYAQYRIFVHDPDPLQFPTGSLGNINSSTVIATPHCDGTVSVTFSVNKPGTVNINFEVDPTPGLQPVDVSILDSVQVGINTITWNGLDGLGNPVPPGTIINMSMTYVNGLTNIALFDVERNEYGFVISQIRPFAPTIATFWNDTLLRAKGGQIQLGGCNAILPDVGCHTWNGDYLGIGIGSVNTVNTWWYATSSDNVLAPIITLEEIDTIQSILGLTTLCNVGSATYSISPNPLPGADPNGYEWLLTDAISGDTIFLYAGQGATINLLFSGVPPGVKRLRARATSVLCGIGPLGPGEGLLINVLSSPSINNTTKIYAVCSGNAVTIPFTLTPSSATVAYTATATSPSVSGYSNGSANPLSQVITTTSNTIDSVLYRVVPYDGVCPGDTNIFIVKVNRGPTITNSVTAFSLCSGSTTNLLLTSSSPSAQFQWSVTGSSPLVTGFSNGSGSIINQTLANASLIPQTVTYVVTASLNACPGTPKSFVYTVNPAAIASISVVESLNPICLGQSVTFTANPVNGGSAPTYQWKVNGGNVGSNLPTYAYTPANNDKVKCILTSNSTCITGNPATSNEITILANIVPYIAFTACFDTMVTNTSKPILLKGGVPLGGTYSGIGVSNGFYYPNVAGSGVHLITYTYTNFQSCASSKTVRIRQFVSSTFTCGNTLTDIRDGQKYATIKIGSQCWMATNLNFGNSISSNLHQRDNCTPEKYINPSSLVPGAMYQWDEMMLYNETPGLQGVCPPSWHIPSEAEWNTLFANWSGNGYAGSPLKYSGYSGFNAGLAGVSHQNVQWDFLDFATFYWTSSAYTPTKAWAHGMNDYNPSVSLYPSLRTNGFSVRCLKD